MSIAIAITRHTVPSPVGPILIEADCDQIWSIRILDPAATLTGAQDKAETGAPAAAAIRQLAAYFDGALQGFDLPLAPAATARGAALRNAILAIPSGETISYGDLAGRVGSSARAIGQACARNPFPIVVPCHRVVGSGQGIGHYSAGRGNITKTWLLDHERRGGLL